MRLTFYLFLTLLFTTNSSYAQKPELLLASTYQDNINVAQYWVSEKLDGVRARWDGHRLISRNGYPFNPPAWFTENFPTQALDGELWIDRQQFQTLSSIVQQYQAKESEWQKVRFMVFDLPHNPNNFGRRLKQMQGLISAANNSHISMIKQTRLRSKTELFSQLERIVSAGGEGLMLHKDSALYLAGRSNDLLKLKPYADAEALVLAHLPGKGKYKGLLGALRLTNAEGLHFKIGTGFSDLERANPPPIGSIITYQYFGKTSSGIPRFASYLRQRKQLLKP